MLSDAWEKDGSEFLVYIGAQVVLFTFALIVTKLFWPVHADPWALADTLQSIALYPAIAYLAIVSSWQLRGNIQSRWTGVTMESHMCMMLYTTRSILHVGIQIMQKMSPGHLCLMSLHHFLSVVCFGSGLVTGNMHFWACMAAVCEVSTVFLNNVWLFKEVMIKGKQLQSYFPGWVYAVNGLCLWLSFIVFRLALFPYWLWRFCADVNLAPEQTWARSNFIERYIDFSVIVFLLILSTYWFIPITRGLLKAVGLGGKAKEDAYKKAA